jgi:8-oxo-dGTP pyrophosphatase MutT (NUDIX family)
LSHCITLMQDSGLRENCLLSTLFTLARRYNRCATILAMNAETTLLLQTLRTRLLPPEQAGSLHGLSYPPATEFGWHTSARHAAVLTPLFEQEGQLSLLFIRRASTLRAHSGEIAFPGGSVETTDNSVIVTALREAQEEIGLLPERVEVLGTLPPVATAVSNFIVTPVVGFLPDGPGTLHVQESEVAEVIVVPLRALMDPAIVHTENWTRNGITRTIYFYDYGPYRIWGATGRMLHELLTVLTA